MRAGTHSCHVLTGSTHLCAASRAGMAVAAAVRSTCSACSSCVRKSRVGLPTGAGAGFVPRLFGRFCESCACRERTMYQHTPHLRAPSPLLAPCLCPSLYPWLVPVTAAVVCDGLRQGPECLLEGSPECVGVCWRVWCGQCSGFQCLGHRLGGRVTSTVDSEPLQA